MISSDLDIGDTTVRVALSVKELNSIGMAMVALARGKPLHQRTVELGRDCLPSHLHYLSENEALTLAKRLATVIATQYADAARLNRGEVTEPMVDNFMRYFWPSHVVSDEPMVREPTALYKRLTIIRGSRVRLPDGTLGLVLYTYDGGERANVARDTGGHQTYMVRELELREEG